MDALKLIEQLKEIKKIIVDNKAETSSSLDSFIEDLAESGRTTMYPSESHKANQAEEKIELLRGIAEDIDYAIEKLERYDSTFED